MPYDVDHFNRALAIYNSILEKYPNAQRDWQPSVYDQFMERRAGLENAMRRRAEYENENGEYIIDDPRLYGKVYGYPHMEAHDVRTLQGLAYAYAPRTYIDHTGEEVTVTPKYDVTPWAHVSDSEIDATRLLDAMGLVTSNNDFPSSVVGSWPVYTNEEDPNYYYDPETGTTNYRKPPITYNDSGGTGFYRARPYPDYTSPDPYADYFYRP